MSTKGDEQGKKIPANTVAFTIRVPRGVHKNLDRFFLFAEKGMDRLFVKRTTYWFSFFLNTVIPLNLVI